MRDRIDDVHAAGAELVIIGNGAANFAEGFREDFALETPLLIDPELRSYRAAGMRRGRLELLSPRMPLNAIRALGDGYRQTAIEGDPWQLGGVFVIRPDGELTFRYASAEAGDHPSADAIIEALDEDAPVLGDDSPEKSWLAPFASVLDFFLDPTVVFSFDSTGFLRHSLQFDPADLDVDLAGKRIVVTGANSGIGFEASRALADLGAEVVMACRDPKRAGDAAERIRSETGSRSVEVAIADLSDLDSVRALAGELGPKPIHALVHNAGLLPDERSLSPQGLELTFATHVAGPHLLTSLLRKQLAKAADPRVVWVTSGGMYTKRLNLDDVDWAERPYDGVTAYAETKRAQVVLTELWAEELRDAGITVHAMHPGWADTPGVQSSLPTFRKITEAILRTPAEGADTIVWLAAAAGATESTGKLYFDRRPVSPYWIPGTRESEADRKQLWALCRKLERKRRQR